MTVVTMRVRSNTAASGPTAGLERLPHAAQTAAEAAAIEFDHASLARREHFIPLTKSALVDRLTDVAVWPSAEGAADARRFFRYLDYWRLQSHTARLLDLQQDYEVFSPDSDLLVTRTFGAAEKTTMQTRVMDAVRFVLTHANYSFVEPRNVQEIFGKDSFYGLDLHVDLDAFEELIIAYRGATHQTAERRKLSKFLRKEEFEVPIFRRLFVLFKLKSDERRIDDLVQNGMDRSKAVRFVKQRRRLLPKSLLGDTIHMKLFKNLPRSDIEMIFPNTEIKFKRWDKLKLGLSSGGALGAGVFGAAGKVALLVSSPLVAIGAILGLGGVAFRQVMNFSNQRQRYMVVMAQNLYFHSMADNRSVLSKLAERAAEEDFKEEILLYGVLSKEPANRRDLPHIDKAIEKYLRGKFGIEMDFDVAEALERLMADGVVREDGDGNLITLQPDAAAALIDRHWDSFLDRLPDISATPGRELPEGTTAGKMFAAV